MPRRQRYREPLGTFDDRQPDFTDSEMRTILAMALDELPPDLRARIAMRRPRVDWQDYDDARRMIAEHLVVRLRRHISCEYRSEPSGSRSSSDRT